MVWQSYDSHNLIVLDEPMAEQLSQYLENKEFQLGAKIADVVFQFEGIPLTEPLCPLAMRLSEAVEEFGKKINRLEQAPKTTTEINKTEKSGWKYAARKIDEGLWQYVEVLEGCVIELFQQIDQIGFEQWNVDVVRAATSIKDELTHRMDDLVWAVRRLEQQLKVCRRACEKREGKWGLFPKVLFVFSRVLDRHLEPTVRKCNKYLNFRYRKFIESYTGYLQLYESGQQAIAKFYHYPVLSSMEINQQDKLKELSILLTLWENNRKARILPLTEPVRALRSLLSFDGALLLFTDYFAAIRNAIFDKSRLIKEHFGLVFSGKQSKQSLIDNIATYRQELGTLKSLIGNYKKFHLQTTPKNGSWTNAFRIKRPENQLPKQFDELSKLTHMIKCVENIAGGFEFSMQSEPITPIGLTAELQDHVNKHLHEMGQPLASKDLMRRNAKALLSSLKSLDEISSFDAKVVHFISHTLCKAMCSDWKYHVLQEIPLFHELYEVHQGIFSVCDDRGNLNRLHKFQRILGQLEAWVKNDETLKHAQEIGLDINDIRAYLQDFLACVQLLEPDGEIFWGSEGCKRPLGQVIQAFLQYLYLFGNFFSHLRPDDAEHRLIRKQLLFIDQYFEAIARRIQELSN